MKKRILGVGALVALLLVGWFWWSGGFHSPRTYTEEELFGYYTGADPTALTQDQMVEDLRYLHEVMEENYPMFDVLERTHGVSWLDRQADHETLIKSSSGMTTFYTTMKKILGELKWTGHGTLVTVEEYDNKRGLYERIDKEPWLSILSHEKTAKMYGALGEKLLKSKGDEEEAQKALSSPPVNLFFKVHEELDTAYVKINSFGGRHMEADLPRLQAFFDEEADRDYLIIDIRGNSGGATDYWVKGITEANIQTAYTTPGYGVFKEGRLYDLFAIQGIKAQSMDRFPGDLQAPEEVYADFDRFYTYSMKLQPDGSTPFKGKAIILMDEMNYSASEGFVLDAKHSGWATLIGRPSGGDGMGRDPVVFALPNSGLVVQFSLEMGLNPDGSCNEETGTQPDILVEKGVDSLDFTLDLIGKSQL